LSLYCTDYEILRSAISWLKAGHRVALVTVAKTWGSSPRPCGSMLVMRDDGAHAGSVSGGCVEEDLLQRYKNNELADNIPCCIDYGVDRQDTVRFGLPCGGRLELVIEPLESATQLNVILQHINNGELITRRVCMNTGEVSLHKPTQTTEFSYDDNHMAKMFGPSWHLLLIGAGHLSRYVTNIALTLNYHITICDPRQEYQADWGLEGVCFSHKMPDDVVREMKNLERGIVLALTHDPKLDDMALMQALNSDLFYVGALGSKRNNELRRERLQELGISQRQLQKLHAPVGLDLGSRTPAEIALAIMAEITKLRNL